MRFSGLDSLVQQQGSRCAEDRGAVLGCRERGRLEAAFQGVKAPVGKRGSFLYRERLLKKSCCGAALMVGRGPAASHPRAIVVAHLLYTFYEEILESE